MARLFGTDGVRGLANRDVTAELALDLSVADGSGGVKHYTIECASPNVLTRIGWKFNTLKPGDKITVLINPLKSGEAGGMLHEVTLADGRKLSDGNPPNGRFDR